MFTGVHGYIKSKFVEERIGMHKNLGTYGCGSITDGTYKMEVRIASFKGTFKGLKGNPVHLIGNINTQGKIHNESSVFEKFFNILFNGDFLYFS